MTEWQCAPFHALDGSEVYKILAARQHVFVLEQQCFYDDFDGCDIDAHHVIAWQTIDGERDVAAYLRVLAPGVKYPEMSLGRVLSSKAARRTGIGRELLAQGIAYAERLYPGQRIRIGAQRYLEHFYASFGFVTQGEPYVEDDIPHVEMLR